jgi:hypothetical protein
MDGSKIIPKILSRFLVGILLFSRIIGGSIFMNTTVNALEA